VSNATGDCYEAAVNLFLTMCEYGRNKENVRNLRLVHAEVEGQGKVKGVRFGHAFVLLVNEDRVLDFSNGGRVFMAREKYYRLGKIDQIDNLRVYEFDEVAGLQMEVETYGPWDLVTSTGL